MKWKSSIVPCCLPLVALLGLAGCRDSSREERPDAAAKVAVRSEVEESPELRQAREMLESVILPEVVFESTSAEEATAYAAIKVRQLAPEKAIRIVARRALPSAEWLKEMNLPEDSGHRVHICYRGYDYTAHEISVWKLLERVANDNVMKIEWVNNRIELRPIAGESEKLALRPLAEDAPEAAE